MGIFRKKRTSRIVTKTIFPVRNMAKATAFYEAAGFTVENIYPDYAFVIHGTEELLHLRKVDKNLEANNCAVFFHVASADDWHTKWANAGLDVSPLVDEDHGMREFSVKDTSGNLIRVGNNL